MQNDIEKKQIGRVKKAEKNSNGTVAPISANGSYKNPSQKTLDEIASLQKKIAAIVDKREEIIGLVRDGDAAKKEWREKLTEKETLGAEIEPLEKKVKELVRESAASEARFLENASLERVVKNMSLYDSYVADYNELLEKIEELDETKDQETLRPMREQLARLDAITDKLTPVIDEYDELDAGTDPLKWFTVKDFPEKTRKIIEFNKRNEEGLTDEEFLGGTDDFQIYTPDASTENYDTVAYALNGFSIQFLTRKQVEKKRKGEANIKDIDARFNVLDPDGKVIMPEGYDLKYDEAERLLFKAAKARHEQNKKAFASANEGGKWVADRLAKLQNTINEQVERYEKNEKKINGIEDTAGDAEEPSFDHKKLLQEKNDRQNELNQAKKEFASKEARLTKLTRGIEKLVATYKFKPEDLLKKELPQEIPELVMPTVVAPEPIVEEPKEPESALPTPEPVIPDEPITTAEKSLAVEENAEELVNRITKRNAAIDQLNQSHEEKVRALEERLEKARKDGERIEKATAEIQKLQGFIEKFDKEVPEQKWENFKRIAEILRYPKPEEIVPKLLLVTGSGKEGRDHIIGQLELALQKIKSE